MSSEFDAAKHTFASESSELLHEMEHALLHLENSPDDKDVINALFRAAHTIKGSSGIIGIETVERFTHVVENVLENVRNDEIKITSHLIELLLRCRDHISTLVGHAIGEESLSQTIGDLEQSLLKELSNYLELKAKPACPSPQSSPQRGEEIKKISYSQMGEEIKNSPLPTGERDRVRGIFETKDANWHIFLKFGRDVLRNGMDPISFINYLSRLGEITNLTTFYDAMPRADEMDPESCYLGFEIDFKSNADRKTIEDVFEFVQEDCAINIQSATPPTPSLIKRGSEGDENVIARSVSDEAISKDGIASPLARNDRIGGFSEQSIDASIEKQKNVMEIKSHETRFIRIDTNKLDKLVNLVGELVISNANINQHAQRIKDTGLSESLSVMSRLVEDIRDNTMNVRMLPIAETFNRFKRIVRDISRDFDKEIELITKGGETELDKTVVEKIGDPLMHLVRNAADHGIENQDVRIKHGKPAKAVIRLNAYHDAGSIVIEVSDDGRGLNKDKILKKAIERGMLNPEQTLADNEIFNLIFEPGFSTADEVTKLSGRGVGMDVVRRNIESLRGAVEVETQEGIGTTVRIRLPLTLAIIDGFMVGVGESFYVIPLDMVVECIELSGVERHTANKRNYINLRGEVLPYMRLREVFNEQDEAGNSEHVVVARYAGHKMGFIVDRLFGGMQAVIKSLGRVYKNIEGISGATILGDGTVALILDVPRLVKSVK